MVELAKTEPEESRNSTSSLVIAFADFVEITFDRELS